MVEEIADAGLEFGVHCLEAFPLPTPTRVPHPQAMVERVVGVVSPLALDRELKQ